MVRDRLERGNELFDVVLAASVCRQGERADSLIGEQSRPGENDLPHLLLRSFGVGIDERGVAEQASDAVTKRRESSIERRLEALYSNRNDLDLLCAMRTWPFRHQFTDGFRPCDAQRFLHLGKCASRLLGGASHMGEASHVTPKLSERLLRGMRNVARRLLDPPNPPVIGGRIGWVLRIQPTTQPLPVLLTQPALFLDARPDLLNLGGRQQAIGPRDIQKRKDGCDARGVQVVVPDGGGCLGHVPRSYGVNAMNRSGLSVVIVRI